jgi:hypothetical protein
METQHLDERAWLAERRARIAARHEVDAADVRVSPGRRRAAFVVSPPPPPPRKRPPRRAPPPRRHRLVVTDLEGRRPTRLPAIAVRGNDDPPRELRFLDDDRLVYEVPLPVTPPPAPAPRHRGAARAPARRAAPPRPLAKAKAPAPPPAQPSPPANEPARRLFVIQPVGRRARPIRCEGTRFAFAARRGRVAFVSGAADAAFVAVNGKRVYPRRGTAALASDPAWAPDGIALAFLEAEGPGTPARLVLLADVDNPTGDTTWDLPPTLSPRGLGVFWAGAGRLVVGKSITAPSFAVSFEMERPRN